MKTFQIFDKETLALRDQCSFHDIATLDQVKLALARRFYEGRNMSDEISLKFFNNTYLVEEQ